VLARGGALFYPQGSNPKPYPRLLACRFREFRQLHPARGQHHSAARGFAPSSPCPPDQRTKLGLAIRAVAQDAETARIMGIQILSSCAAHLRHRLGHGRAGRLMNGLYYNEVNFGMGLLLGVIGFPRGDRRLGTSSGPYSADSCFPRCRAWAR